MNYYDYRNEQTLQPDYSCPGEEPLILTGYEVIEVDETSTGASAVLRQKIFEHAFDSFTFR